jgi:hypothetical protein
MRRIITTPINNIVRPITFKYLWMPKLKEWKGHLVQQIRTVSKNIDIPDNNGIGNI